MLGHLHRRRPDIAREIHPALDDACAASSFTRINIPDHLISGLSDRFFCSVLGADERPSESEITISLRVGRKRFVSSKGGEADSQPDAHSDVQSGTTYHRSRTWQRSKSASVVYQSHKHRCWNQFPPPDVQLDVECPNRIGATTGPPSITGFWMSRSATDAGPIEHTPSLPNDWRVGAVPNSAAMHGRDIDRGQSPPWSNSVCRNPHRPPASGQHNFFTKIGHPTRASWVESGERLMRRLASRHGGWPLVSICKCFIILLAFGIVLHVFFLLVFIFFARITSVWFIVTHFGLFDWGASRWS